jgi:prepilin-type N-terminal cleavage/methylation domain-containing protein
MPLARRRHFGGPLRKTRSTPTPTRCSGIFLSSSTGPRTLYRSKTWLVSKGSRSSRRNDAGPPEVRGFSLRRPETPAEPECDQSPFHGRCRPRSLARMDRQKQPLPAAGYSLIEVLVVLAILGLAGGVGSLSLSHGLRHQEARGAAQVWQAASAWTQVGVLWRGGSGRITYSGGDLSLSHAASLFGGDLGMVAPAAPVDTNLTRWAREGGVSVSFSGVLASPDGGGSVFFNSWTGSYRVTVRPETGLMVRSWVAVE